jgi:hypothetical protein
MSKKRGTGERVKRTREEWEALKAQREAELPPDPDEGYIRVRVDGQYIYAPSVEYLQRNGFQVLVSYRRYFKSHAYSPFFSQVTRTRQQKKEPPQKMPRAYTMNPKGGSTRVVLLRHDGVWGDGSAVCVSKDVFSKRIGYALAVNKALEMVEVTVRARTLEQPIQTSLPQ